MNLVVDASVIVKWYVEEADTHIADALAVDHRFVFCVPAHAFSEVGNALATNIRRGLLSRDRLPMIGGLLSSSVRTYPINGLMPAAVEIALDIGTTVYDALYIALAAELATSVATADTRLVNAASRSAWRERVRLVGDFVR